MLTFLNNLRFCNYLALNEIKQKYRRSSLGTLWMSLSTAITILAIGPLYSILFQTNLSDYFVIVSIGLISWNFISSIIGESCGVYIANAGMIKDVNLPLEIYCYIVVWRNVILLMQNLFLLYIILNILGYTIFPNFKLLLIIVLLIYFLTNIGLILALICTRFRDFSQIVDTAMRLLFLITPILWMVKDSKLANSSFLKYNLFYYLVDLFRDAFINDSIVINHLVLIMILAIASGIVSFSVMSKYRSKIVYWL